MYPRAISTISRHLFLVRSTPIHLIYSPSAVCTPLLTLIGKYAPSLKYAPANCTPPVAQLVNLGFLTVILGKRNTAFQIKVTFYKRILLRSATW